MVGMVGIGGYNWDSGWWMVDGGGEVGDRSNMACRSLLRW
jgi:hypothetical protein